MEIFSPFLVLFLSFLLPLSAGEFKTRRIPMLQIISLLIQVHLGEFKTGKIVCKCSKNEIKKKQGAKKILYTVFLMYQLRINPDLKIRLMLTKLTNTILVVLLLALTSVLLSVSSFDTVQTKKLQVVLRLAFRTLKCQLAT